MPICDITSDHTATALLGSSREHRLLRFRSGPLGVFACERGTPKNLRSLRHATAVYLSCRGRQTFTSSMRCRLVRTLGADVFQLQQGPSRHNGCALADVVSLALAIKGGAFQWLS